MPSEIQVAGSACGVRIAGVYSLNATVVPPATLGFVSMWACGQQPVVSTLNAVDGTIVSNAALVPASPTGSVCVIVTPATQLILDINLYFAQ